MSEELIQSLNTMGRLAPRKDDKVGYIKAPDGSIDKFKLEDLVDILKPIVNKGTAEQIGRGILGRDFSVPVYRNRDTAVDVGRRQGKIGVGVKKRLKPGILPGGAELFGRFEKGQGNIGLRVPLGANRKAGGSMGQLNLSKYQEGDSIMKGGSVSENDFVIDAATVAMAGNGSSEAGAEKIMSQLPQVENRDGSFMGLVQGRGDGMADTVMFDVPDSNEIDTAAISNDEIVVDSEQVAKIGEGNIDKGVERLNDARKEIRLAATGSAEQPKEIDSIEILRKEIGLG